MTFKYVYQVFLGGDEKDNKVALQRPYGRVDRRKAKEFFVQRWYIYIYIYIFRRGLLFLAIREREGGRENRDRGEEGNGERDGVREMERQVVKVTQGGSEGDRERGRGGERER
jgi:hypothetical protein